MKNIITILSLYISFIAISQSNDYQVYQLDTKESIQACNIVAYLDNTDLDAGYVEKISGSIITLRITQNTDYLIQINNSKYFKIYGSNIDAVTSLPKVSLVNDPALIYRIQLGAFSKTIPTSLFANFKDVVTEKMDGTNLTRFMTGNFNSLKDATNVQKQIQSMGNKDAFIVAYYNGERIKYTEALKKEVHVDQLETFELTMVKTLINNKNQIQLNGMN